MSVAEAEQYLKRAEETFQDADDELKLTKAGKSDMGMTKKEAQEIWDFQESQNGRSKEMIWCLPWLWKVLMLKLKLKQR